MATDDTEKRHNSETLLIERYNMDSATRGPNSKGNMSAASHLDLYGVSKKDMSPMMGRIHFVEGTFTYGPSYNSTKRLIEATMHTSMLPMVLATLCKPGCYLTFEDKPGEPIAYIRDPRP